MGEPIVNRNDNQYSSDMETIMDTATETGWRHEDGSPCTHPEDCRKIRDLQFWGGRPGFGTFTE